MKTHSTPLNGNLPAKRDSAGKGSTQALRNRIAARMLLAGLVPVATIYGFRYFWKEALRMPEEHLSYQVMVVSFVLILSAALASFFSRSMIHLLREAGGTEPDDEPELGARVPQDAAPARDAALRSLLESGSDAVLLVDHACGRVEGASRRFREIFGFGDEVPESLPYSEVKTRVAACFSSPEKFEETWARLATSDARVTGESFGTFGVDARELELTSEPLAGAGEPLRMWVFVDVTEIVALRAELCRAQRRESIGALAGGVAHDFNNMLTGVIGNLALAEIESGEEGGSGQGRQFLARAKVAGLRAAELARTLIGYAGESGCESRRFDIAGAVRDAGELLRPGLESVREFRVEADDGIGHATGDASEIEQVLVGLCADARDALQGRLDGLIVLSARRVEGSPRRAELIVRDNRATDPSVPPKFLPAISGEIVRRHGGNISRECGAGGGSLATISLPCADETVPGGNEGAAAAPTAVDRSGKGHGGETILLVDDEELVRTVGEKMLRHRGYTLRTAADGLEALAAFDAAPYGIDVVVLDLTMPRVSGAATFRMLKERDASLPIIVCSGYEVDADSFEEENGWRPDGILRKPFHIDGLAGEVRRVLDAHAGLILEAGI